MHEEVEEDEEEDITCPQISSEAHFHHSVFCKSESNALFSHWQTHIQKIEAPWKYKPWLQVDYYPSKALIFNDGKGLVFHLEPAGRLWQTMFSQSSTATAASLASS